jgi:hypothetical protein
LFDITANIFLPNEKGAVGSWSVVASITFIMSSVLSSTCRGLWARRSMPCTSTSKVATHAIRSKSSPSSTSKATRGKNRGNSFERAFAWYGDKLETHPIITKGLTAGVIGAMGDVMCQIYIDKPEKEIQMQQDGEQVPTQALWWWESGRTTRFFVLGVGLVGPWCHSWYGFLARKLPKLTVSSIVTRVALDQFAFTPVILTTFISSLWTLEGAMGDTSEEEAKKTIPQRLKETLPDVIVANWMLWGPVQLFNFRVVPQKYQVLFANMISLVWNAYLSFSTRGPAPVDEKTEQEILEHAPIPVVLVQRLTTPRNKQCNECMVYNSYVDAIPSKIT